MDGQGPDVEGLEWFAERKDRQESPIFVGREQEIDHVLRQAELVAQAHANGEDTQGATILITGCPGSGKSAFLSHFARRFATEALTGATLIPVRCNHINLTASGSEDLEAQLAQLVSEERGSPHKTRQALLDDAGEMLKLRKTFRRLGDRAKERSAKGAVVCLLVDEIQNVTERSARAVQLLHTEEFSPPVLPVYAGLDDSADALERVCGISRLSTGARVRMGELPRRAARKAARELFDRYRVRGDDGARAAWSEAIEEESLGFAQHLHLALQAACRVLVAASGTAHVAGADEVRQQAQDARERFYASKMDGTVGDHAHAVLDVVHLATEANTPLTRRQLAASAREAMRRHDPLAEEPTADEALALVERMRRRGILHLSGDGRAEVPIPSLRAWLTGPYAAMLGYEPGGQENKPGRRRRRAELAVPVRTQPPKPARESERKRRRENT